MAPRRSCCLRCAQPSRPPMTVHACSLHVLQNQPIHATHSCILAWVFCKITAQTMLSLELLEALLLDKVIMSSLQAPALLGHLLMEDSSAVCFMREHAFSHHTIMRKSVIHSTWPWGVSSASSLGSERLKSDGPVGGNSCAESTGPESAY